MPIVTILLLVGTAALAGCGPTAERTYTLYRDSSVDPLMRIHVATFDADGPVEYNHENCERARALFQDQPGILTRYWCEAGAYHKQLAPRHDLSNPQGRSWRG